MISKKRLMFTPILLMRLVHIPLCALDALFANLLSTHSWGHAMLVKNSFTGHDTTGSYTWAENEFTAPSSTNKAKGIPFPVNSLKEFVFSNARMKKWALVFASVLFPFHQLSVYPYSAVLC